MWLIDTQTLKLDKREFFDSRIPSYAILSHTWGDGEVRFQDIQALELAELRKKAGWQKIELCCKQALADGYSYAWVDTCCINKESSTQLQESLNSMFRWYEKAQVCYAFLTDVTHPNPDQTITDDDLLRLLMPAKWFTRGWTLQELIAPKFVRFYDRYWEPIGNRDELAEILSVVTGINSTVLRDSTTLGQFSIAARMSWAANRETTREEDIAYCLFGIFDVSIFINYGEGVQAFVRLQEEIMSKINDDSILAWDATAGREDLIRSMDRCSTVGVLAKHPSFFKGKGSIVYGSTGKEPWSMTASGLCLPSSRWVFRRHLNWDLLLNCDERGPSGSLSPIAVPLQVHSSPGLMSFGRRQETLFVQNKTLVQKGEYARDQPIYLSRNDVFGNYNVVVPTVLSYPRAILDTNRLSGGQLVRQHGLLELLDLHVVDFDNNCRKWLAPRKVSDEAQQFRIKINRQRDGAFLFRYRGLNGEPYSGPQSRNASMIEIFIYPGLNGQTWKFVALKSKIGSFVPGTRGDGHHSEIATWQYQIPLKMERFDTNWQETIDSINTSGMDDSTTAWSTWPLHLRNESEGSQGYRQDLATLKLEISLSTTTRGTLELISRALCIKQIHNDDVERLEREEQQAKAKRQKAEAKERRAIEAANRAALAKRQSAEKEERLAKERKKKKKKDRRHMAYAITLFVTVGITIVMLLFIKN